MLGLASLFVSSAALGQAAEAGGSGSAGSGGTAGSGAAAGGAAAAGGIGLGTVAAIGVVGAAVLGGINEVGDDNNNTAPGGVDPVDHPLQLQRRLPDNDGHHSHYSDLGY